MEISEVRKGAIKKKKKRKWCQIFSVAWIVFKPRFSNLGTRQTPEINYYQNAKQQHPLRVKHFQNVHESAMSSLWMPQGKAHINPTRKPNPPSTGAGTSTPAQTELKPIPISATGVTCIKPCEALKYFTDRIRTSRSKSAALLLQPRRHKGSPDGSTGQKLIYLFSPTCITCHDVIFVAPLSPVRMWDPIHWF